MQEEHRRAMTTCHFRYRADACTGNGDGAGAGRDGGRGTAAEPDQGGEGR
jgi:hypothetical protein